MIVVDTSALIAAADRGQPDHTRVVRTISESTSPLILPAGMLGEAAYILEVRYGLRHLVDFLRDIRDGVFLVDCGEPDLDRIETLVTRYGDLPLGFADAAVVACAERYGGQVLTLDLRHFGVVAREGTITILP